MNTCSSNRLYLCARSRSVPRTTARLLATVLLVGMGSANGAEALREGAAFPALTEYALEGRLPELGGKVVLVDFWASWCAPCKKSFPSLDTLYQQYAAAGFEIAAVSVDDSAKAMRRFLKTNPVSFPVVRDAEKRLVSDVKVQAMPTSFLLDRQGVVRAVHNGFHGEETEEQLRAEIESLLGKEPTSP